MLFRFASLYGIGKQLKRHTCMQGVCAENYRSELYAAFSNLKDFPFLVKLTNFIFSSLLFTV
jgi:hypothetical protein